MHVLLILAGFQSAPCITQNKFDMHVEIALAANHLPAEHLPAATESCKSLTHESACSQARHGGMLTSRLCVSRHGP